MTTLRTLAVLIPLTGCCLVHTGSGHSSTETRQLDRHDAVALGTMIDVDVVLGAETDAIELTCDDNLLRYIDTDVRQGVLEIDTPQGVHITPRTACYATLYTADLNGLTVSGSGSMAVVQGELTDLQDAAVSGSGELWIGQAAGCRVVLDVSGSGGLQIGSLTACSVDADVSGSGGVDVNGAADALLAATSGSGDLDASGLQVIDATARASGSGSIRLTASGHVDAAVSGSGDVIVMGDPESVDATSSGSGNVIEQ